MTDMMSDGLDLISADTILASPPVARQFTRLDHTTRMMAGHWITQAVRTAAELELARHVAAGADHLAPLAVAAGAHSASLARLLRALLSLGVFARVGERLELTPASRALLDDDTRRGAISAGAHQAHTWGDLTHSVRTGEPGFDKVYGMPVFEYLAKNPFAGQLFDSAMSSFHGREIDAVTAACPLQNARRIVDLGGGNGALVGALLAAHPALHGVVFDLPGVVTRTAERLRETAYARRIDVVGGSFEESPLPIADTYLLRHVVHNWSDSRARQLLCRFRRQWPERARLLIVESVIPDDDRPFFGKLLDLAMLVIPGGRERTEREYHDLLGATGFELVECRPTTTESSVLAADPV